MKPPTVWIQLLVAGVARRKGLQNPGDIGFRVPVMTVRDQNASLAGITMEHCALGQEKLWLAIAKGILAPATQRPIVDPIHRTNTISNIDGERVCGHVLCVNNSPFNPIDERNPMNGGYTAIPTQPPTHNPYPCHIAPTIGLSLLRDPTKAGCPHSLAREQGRPQIFLCLKNAQSYRLFIGPPMFAKVWLCRMKQNLPCPDVFR